MTRIQFAPSFTIKDMIKLEIPYLLKTNDIGWYIEVNDSEIDAVIFDIETKNRNLHCLNQGDRWYVY